MTSRLLALSSKLKRIVWRTLRLTSRDLYVASAYWKALTKQGKVPLSLSGIQKTRTILHCHHALLALSEIYQPVLAPGLTYLKAKRPCKDRLALIANDMGAPPATVSDIGCQIGFFTFSLAEQGYSMTGYDMDVRNIEICRMLNELSGLSTKPTFRNIALMPETAESFEAVDYTLCLAVFHHVIYYHGLSVAQELVPVLRNKTRKKLYFEIGQSNEPVEPWAKHMPDMGTDPPIWIMDFLRSGGFEDVKVLGLVPTHVSDVPRYLIVVS